MYNAVSALSGKAYTGSVSVTETGLRGMITLRGDLASRPVRQTVETATGVSCPAQMRCSMDQDRGIAWMSPDEVLIMVPYADAVKTVQLLSDALADEHVLIANVSDARAVFRLEGEGIREVIAKLCPVDMAPHAFFPGHIRRTRMAQIAAAFWMRDETTLDLVCFRSVADYAMDILSFAARPGAEVDVF